MNPVNYVNQYSLTEDDLLDLQVLMADEIVDFKKFKIKKLADKPGVSCDHCCFESRFASGFCRINFGLKTVEPYQREWTRPCYDLEGKSNYHFIVDLNP